MKAEERKALESTALEAGFKEMRKAVGQGPPRSVVIGLVVAVVVVGLFFVWRWLSSRASETSSNLLVLLEQMSDGTDVRALEKFVDANIVKPNEIPPEWMQSARRDQLMLAQLKKFAEDNPRSVEGRMARLRLARMSLYLGERDVTSPLPFSKLTARENLERARDVYSKLVVDCGDAPILQQEALLNQGRACESLGQFEEAGKLYQQLADNKDPNPSPSIDLAKQAVARLKNKVTDEQAKDLYKATLGSAE
jgi:tetratricopeptide (TPR) repeat protein